MSDNNSSLKRPVGSLAGFLISIAIGLVIYWLLNNIKGLEVFLTYNDIVAKTAHDPFHKLLWLLMDFTEAEFYAGVFAGIFIIIGAFIAWRLDVKNSRLAGFNICYGTNTWPWVFASQVLSMILVLYVLNYTHLFNEYTFLPTFITVVGGPPALMLIYGPNPRALITGSILGAFIAFPIAFWLMTKVISVINVPVVVANVTTMALIGIIMCQVFKVLPWIEKTPYKTINRQVKELSREEKIQDMSKPSWFIRRVFADFSEAQFYGNEIAGIFLIIGVIIDFILNTAHPAYGSGLLPAMILAQIVGSATGIFLYFDKWVEKGWYATFVPVVSSAPACVLAFGGTIPVALFAGILSGIIGAPYAEYLANKLPEDFHPTIANVTSMAVTTIIVYVVMQALPWF
ncbi:hypothetical protein [Thermosyntropha sp.]|uniref:hypothetical protein n=1 Tax=Thermosyntropha sp. TaxID=2740820 RepID=UPI0025DF4B15|nr:hypothetical protein [Thermosyntropha sp.]MBO8158809.1 hypothetical protein [Thermosyntropha sp.]